MVRKEVVACVSRIKCYLVIILLLIFEDKTSLKKEKEKEEAYA